MSWWFRIDLWKRVMVGLALGAITGLLLRQAMGPEAAGANVTAWAKPSARAQLAANPQPGSVAEQLMQTILSIIPTNPVAAMANGDVLPIIFFAIMFGMGILVSGDAGKPLAAVMNSAAEAMMRLTLIVMETAPFGVFALMAWVMGDRGLTILAVLGKMTAALYIACALHMFFTYGSLVKFVLRLPLFAFFRGAVDAQAVAFSTSSSNATLPMTMSCATENLGISKPIASSVLPLGATINMDGTALYQGLIALFAAQALGLPMTASMYFTIAIMATLVSIGTAGIPSVSLFLAATTLSVVGVSPDQTVLIIALLFPFDRILDMMRTVTNVTGDLAVATTVAKWEGELDEDVFRARDPV